MTEHLTPDESPGFLLWQVTNRWQREVVAALRPLELTHVQFVLLATAWWHTTHGDGPPTQRALADFAGSDPMMASQVLRALEGRGLVERRPDPQDGRVRRVAATAAGAELALRAIVVVEAADSAFFAPVDGAAALALLKQLAV